jgi:DNA (cytosine-5)-methyltransferase 1
MKVLTVCSGIGAPECAWAPLGFNFVAQSEIEAFPSAVLAHRFPGVPNWGDMTKFKEWPDADVDVLVGGTPCQSFSVAGLRKGLADPRGNLALTYLAIADRYRPEWLVWENVPGVLSSGGGRDFGSFLGALVQLGYGFAYRVLDAQYFGVAQRRRRVFVVGCLGGWHRAAAVLFERESLQGHPAPRRSAGKKASAYVIKGAAIGREPHNGPQHGEILNDGSVYTLNCTETHAVAWTPEISNSLTARQGKEPAPDPTEGAPLMPFTAHALRGEGFDASEDGTGRGTPLVPVSYRTSGNCGAWETGDKTDALTTATDPDHHVLAFSSKDYGADAAIDIAPTMRAMGHAGSHANAGGQLAVATLAIRGSGDESNLEYRTDGTANALLTPNGGRAGIGVGAIQYGTAVRRLTPRECERLQGFPDDWTAITHRNKPAADGPRYKALGNSMAVPVLRWIGERIMWIGQMTDNTEGEA